MKLPPHLARYASEFAKASAETGLDAALIAAVCDRESGGGLYLSPRGPGGVGDSGHGHGLMQLDDRTWAAWLAKNKWWEPQANISKGAEVLSANLVRFEATFDPLFCAVAAYNCGPGNVRAALLHAGTASPEAKRLLVDRRTTGGDYASDTLARRARFLSAKESA